MGSVLDKEVARSAYVEKVLGFVDCSKLKPLKIVINSGNGAAGPSLDAIKEKLAEKVCKQILYLCIIVQTQLFPMASPIHCWRKTGHIQRTL